MIRAFLALSILLLSLPAMAGTVTLSVASNFLSTAEDLAKRFEATTGHDVILVHGSTGQLFAQITAGAPYDIFLSADAERPDRLVELNTADERKTYAIGRLVLISKTGVSRDSVAEAISGKAVVLADPIVAPYGLAATAAMESLSLDTATFKPILVANVGQVATVFATGNGDFAFVSAAQLPLLNAPYTLDLDGLYPPIRQDAAYLKRASENAAAQSFWDWLSSEEAKAIILAAGYDLGE